MKTGYTLALEAHATVCIQPPYHSQHSHSAGPLEGNMQQPQQQDSLQAPLAPSSTSITQGYTQQPSHHAGPHALAKPQHHSRLAPQTCHGEPGSLGIPLQACRGRATVAINLNPNHPAPPPALLPGSSGLQPLEDEAVCCAQPALPSALPRQPLLATRAVGPSPVQLPGAAGIGTVLPADRSSSSGRFSDKADEAGHASKPARQQSIRGAHHADPSASAARVHSLAAGQGQLRGSDTSTDKENSGSGKGAGMV